MKHVLRPGEICEVSGIYADPEGYEATIVQGEPAPPTRKSGWSWSLVRETIHR